MADDSELEASEAEQKSRAGLIGAAVVAAGLLAFIFQNTEKAPVEWLFFSGEAPVWIVIVVAAIAGLVLGELIGWVLRRRRN